MGFEVIDPSEYASGKPIVGVGGFGEKVKNSLDFLNGSIGTLTSYDIMNGSFEVDSDNDGTPDNWAVSLYPNGAAEIDITDSSHGAQSLMFTHPGASGNGGGYATTDIVPISDLSHYLLEWSTKSSLALLHNLVEVKFFDIDGNLLSTETAFEETSGSLTYWNSKSFSMSRAAEIPDTARFIQVIAHGGVNDVDPTAEAYIWYDDFRLIPKPIHSISPDEGGTECVLLIAPTAQGITSGGGTYTKLKEGVVGVWGKVVVSFEMRTSSAGSTQTGRLKINGVTTGTTHTDSGATTNYESFSEEITIKQGDVISLECKRDGAVNGNVRNFKITAYFGGTAGAVTLD